MFASVTVYEHLVESHASLLRRAEAYDHWGFVARKEDDLTYQRWIGLADTVRQRAEEINPDTTVRYCWVTGEDHKCLNLIP